MTGYDAPIGYDEPTGYDGGAPPTPDFVEVPLLVRVGLSVLVTESETLPSEVITVPLSCTVNVLPRVLLTPVAPPLGVLTEWPIQRQAHLMSALSEANPRYQGGVDYDIEREDIGRAHVFVEGRDVTYLRGAPAQFDDYTSAVPVGPVGATVAMPQLKPWDETGTGDLSMFTPDAAVDIAIVHPDDTVEQVWEGFFSAEEDSSGQGSEDYRFRAEGLFFQAAHTMYDPPVFMDPIDPGYLVADLLNSVPHRRWNKIPRFKSGLTPVTDRGTKGQSVWQRVQDVLSKAWRLDGRQLSLMRVAPYTYRLGFKAALSTVHFTVTKGAPGVEVALSADQSQRRDCVYARGVAKDGGVWENRFFPGLDFGVPPRYPMADAGDNMNVGTTDADTATGSGVSQWQRRMRDLGYPVKVDGVMNSSDTKWVLKIQRARGITVDGSLGPQTWAATFENNSTKMDLSSIRLPMVTLDDASPSLYHANGSVAGRNPADDPRKIVHAMTEVDFGFGISKADALPLAQQILDRESVPGWQGTITLLTDPHETGSSRFDIRPGHNVKVIGHRGDTTVQVSEVSVSGLEVRLTVDTQSRDALSVAAILERDREVRRDISARRSGHRDQASLNQSAVVQYEAESKAGKLTKTAVNGDSGLWTVRKVFVSQVGVAKVVFSATSPKAEFVVALFNKPIKISTLHAKSPDPLSSKDGWFDNYDDLRDKYGLMEVYGSPSSPCGYFPRQKGDGPLTGRFEDTSSTLYDSPYGGFVWVAMYASRSTWIEGRMFPAVPT